MLQTLTKEELAVRLGLSGRFESGGDSPEPLAWGIARLIRREIRRRGLATRRELSKSIETLLRSSGFDDDVGGCIRGIADRMVMVGELLDVRVDNQRGYAALPSRWISLSKDSAVLLGTVFTEQHRFQSYHAKQFLRRFHPSGSIVSDLDRIGVKRQSFAGWFGAPEWLRLARTDETLRGLGDLWQWYVSQLRDRGALLDLQHTKALAIVPKPGAFFGRPWSPGRTRWAKPGKLPDGCYLGAQPGYNERQWHPLIIEISGCESRSLLVGEGLKSSEAYDLYHWLLLARAESMEVREQIIVYTGSNQIALSFPAPRQLVSSLELIGESTATWKYSLFDVAAVVDLIGNEFAGIEFVAG